MFSSDPSRRKFLTQAGLISLASSIPSAVWAVARTPFEQWDLIKPYLKGVYAPAFIEMIKPIPLKVIGQIPQEISGSYFRNGPNPKYPAFKEHHWFDGDGMIHKIALHQGQATYQNRWIETNGLRLEEEYGEKMFAGLDEIGDTKNEIMAALNGLGNSIRQINLSAHPMGRALKDTANTDLIYFRGKIIPLWWLSGTPYTLDPRTLETTGVETFNNTYGGEMAAHARVDSETGELFFLNFGQILRYVTVNKVGADGRLKWSERFDLPYARIYHDLLFTKDYVILLDFPLGFITDPATGKPIIGFDRSAKTGFSRIVLINRENPKIQHAFTFEASYVLHGLNAYQENERVTLFVTKFTDPIIHHENDDDRIPKVGLLRVETVTARWDLNIEKNTFAETRVDNQNSEFARINDKWLGHRSQFSYHPSLRPESTVIFDGLFKLNLQTGAKVSLPFGKNLIGEEAVFIPRRQAKSEDDGWVATFVQDRTSLECEYRIYDAKSFYREPVARIQIPRALKIPYGFHSKWVEDVI